MSLAFVWGIHRDGEFPAQRASNAENVSIWWRHHVMDEELHVTFYADAITDPRPEFSYSLADRP